MPVSILATKLYIPAPRFQVVPRPRLIQQLSEGLVRNLTLVSASAGFGKTTLLSEWIPNIGRPVAWLSLDERDNDSTRFLSYLVAAFQTVIPEIGKNLQAELQSHQPPPVESILTNLLNDIIHIDKPLLLVLDDYHRVDAKSIDDLLTFVLEHMPPQLHLVITTREDPNNLPLPRLRARQLTEIRATDLRFTAAEAGKFLKQVMGLALSENDIAALETRTEGWIVGLQLAALSMQGKKDLPKFVKSFTGSHHFVLDYLLQEVLQAQTEDVRNFLLNSAILDRLSGPLCDAVLQYSKNSAQKILESIEQANLFLIPLDNERQWYRYHHLFNEVLQAHLVKEQPEKVSVLHLRASEWFDKNAQRPDAIRHALAAKDLERAAALIERVWPEADRFVFSAPWLAWVKALPENLVRTRPILMLNYAQALFFVGNLEEGEYWLNQVENLFSLETTTSENIAVPAGMHVVDETQFRQLPSAIAFSRAYHASSCGHMARAIQYSQLILKLAVEDDISKQLTAMSIIAFSNCTLGELDVAYETFSNLISRLHSYGRFSDTISATFILADIKAIQGCLTDAAELYENASNLASKETLADSGMAFLYLGLSNLHCAWGDYELALQNVEKSIELNKKAPLQLCRYRIALARANIKQSLGDLHGTLEELNKAEQLYYRNILPEYQTVSALKARVWIKQGRLNDAQAWARKQQLSVTDELSFAHEFDHLTLARLLLAQHRKEGLESALNQAHGFLARLNAAAKAGNRFGRLIEILILQSLAHQAGHATNNALKTLTQALDLAEPEGFMQIFVGEGKPLQSLLRAAEAKEIMPDYVRKILKTFEINQQHAKKSASFAQPRSTIHSTTDSTAITTTSIATTPLNDTLLEPLSQRELKVLQLVAQGLSNREIGERLCLALDTVKGLNRRIFSKLQVQRRTEAVAKARSLNLLCSK